MISVKMELINLLYDLFKEKELDIKLIESADLINDLGMDSITFISMIVEIETHFNIVIPDNLLLMDRYRCIDDIVKIIQNIIHSSAIGTEVCNNV